MYLSINEFFSSVLDILSVMDTSPLNSYLFSMPNISFTLYFRSSKMRSKPQLNHTAQIALFRYFSARNSNKFYLINQRYLNSMLATENKGRQMGKRVNL